MRIRYSKTAQGALLRSHKRDLIRRKIEAFAESADFSVPNVSRLKGQPEFRLRVQDWRVLFQIDEDEMTVIDIAPRGSAYKD